MATGVKLAPETHELYKIFKLQKTPHMFVVLYIDDGLIKVERTVDKQNETLSQEEQYNLFVQTLPKDHGRYFWADLTVPSKSGQTKQMMFSVAWWVWHLDFFCYKTYFRGAQLYRVPKSLVLTYSIQISRALESRLSRDLKAEIKSIPGPLPGLRGGLAPRHPLLLISLLYRLQKGLQNSIHGLNTHMYESQLTPQKELTSVNDRNTEYFF